MFFNMCPHRIFINSTVINCRMTYKFSQTLSPSNRPWQWAERIQNSHHFSSIHSLYQVHQTVSHPNIHQSVDTSCTASSTSCNICVVLWYDRHNILFGSSNKNLTYKLLRISLKLIYSREISILIWMMSGSAKST